MIHILVAAQVAVLLLLGGAVLSIRATENKAREHTARLAGQIAETDFVPLMEAEAAREAREMFLDIDGNFDSDRLATVIENIPDGVRLATVDYSGAVITLVAYADHLSDIGTHQSLLRETNKFQTVLLGQLNRLENGRIRYTLRLGVEP